MFGLQWIDIAVIFIYFVVLISIGLRAMKRIRNQEDYFLGGRRFGKLVQVFAAFGMATSSETAVGTTTTTYNNGASGVWSNLLILWATPIYWLMAPWYRRLRVLTLGDFFEQRYGSRLMAMLYAVLMAIYMMGGTALGLKAVSVTVSAVAQKGAAEYTTEEQAEYNQAVELDQLRELKSKGQLNEDQQDRLDKLEALKPRKEFSHINENLLIWIMCAIVFVYAVAGGLEAAVYTDMLQGIFIIILSLLLIPFGMAKINTLFGSSGVMGAFQAMHHQLPEWYFDIFGSAKSLDFTWYYIAALSIMATINVGVQATQLNAYGAAKDELTARFGATTGCFIKRFCTVLWGFLGLIAVTLYAGQLKNPDYVWGYATRDLLGGLGAGLVGLMIASLLAALMSSTDMMMITSSGLLTRNVYRQIFSRFSETHYVRVGRILGGCVLIGAVLLAIWFDTILQLLKFLWEFNIILAASFWCGMKWRRANTYGAWCSMIFTLVCFSLLPTLLPKMMPSLCTKSSLLRQTDPPAIIRTYAARQMDVNLREEQINLWQQKTQLGQTTEPCPQSLVVGEKITKTIQPPRKALFWSKGITIEKGERKGDGFFYLELVLLDQVWDLSKNPYALNETVRTLIRTFTPFVILILVSLLTPVDKSERLKRFFAKMRTPVIQDRQKDRQELELSYNNPDRFQDRLLLKNSNFELFKWGKIDAIGFVLSVLTVFGILGVLYILLNIGA